MDSLIGKLRAHIGVVVAFFGFVLLSILTFGDLGEILSDKYWENVAQNMSSIGFLSLGLTAVQVIIKQGIAEQALRKGLNSEETSKKYVEHRKIINDCRYKERYIGYFLDEYNARKTKERKRAFIIRNNYKTEKDFLLSAPKRLKKHYAKICHCVTANKIVWATTTVEYDKHGNIRTLAEHRRARAFWGVIMGFIAMLGVTLIARGLFFESANIPFWQRLVKFLSYIFTIALFSVPSVIKEYEKGRFGVPNDLDEINAIWEEFRDWEVPERAVNEADSERKQYEEVIESEREEAETAADVGTDL